MKYNLLTLVFCVLKFAIAMLTFAIFFADLACYPKREQSNFKVVLFEIVREANDASQQSYYIYDNPCQIISNFWHFLEKFVQKQPHAFA